MASAEAPPARSGAPPLLGAPQGRFALPADSASVAEARRRTRDRLTDRSVDADTCDAAVLVVSELFTNAVVHTDSESVVCEIRTGRGQRGTGDGYVHIAVHSQGLARAGGDTRPACEEHGRGLLLVEAVSTAWGISDGGPGRGWSVWARLATAERQAAGRHGGGPC